MCRTNIVDSVVGGDSRIFANSFSLIEKSKINKFKRSE